MRLLHTSDWHVGKRIRGNSRAIEHRAVLAEIAGIARDRSVDLVLVAGDLFESAAPTPEAEQIVYEALLELAQSAPHVAVIAGNHDNPRRLAAIAPLLALGRITLVPEPVRPSEGGVVQLRADGHDVMLGLLPFVSQRGIVRAGELMDDAAFENVARYADRYRLLVESLAHEFHPDAANVLVAHAFVRGGEPGGGERMAHLAEEYAVPAPSLPVSAGYVALGHLHRAQKVAGPTAIHYSGSPLGLDFGEQEDRKSVNVVELRPGAPAAVDRVPLRSGRPLHTLRGSLDELGELDVDPQAWLRVRVVEARRARLAEDVRALLGDQVVDVVIDSGDRPSALDPPRRHVHRRPTDLFADYLSDVGVSDRRIASLFAELLEEEVSTQ